MGYDTERFNQIACWAAVLLATVLLTLGTRGCWANTLVDRQQERQLREKCAVSGGLWMQVGGDTQGKYACWQPMRISQP